MAGGKIDILVEPDVKGFAPKLEAGLSGALGTAGKLGAAFGVAFGGAELAKSVTSIGLEFDKQMNTMSAVSQATGAQLDAVAARARELGKDSDLTATSAIDAAAAMTELAKGGFSVEQSMEAAKGTLQLAAAAQTDAANAATIQSQALQAFSLSAQDAGRVSDILAGAANASSAEIGDVAAALQQSGTVAQQFGVSIDDTATAIAMFANAGITGSDAGTLLKTALLSLTDQGKPAQQAIEELGLTVYDAQGKFVGMESLMGQLNDASKSMTAEQYQAATATLFGSDAMRMAGIAAEKGSEDFNKLRESVTRQGQAADVAAAQTQKLPGILERLENTKEDLFQGIYDAIDENLIGGANKAVDILEASAPLIIGAFELMATGADYLGESLAPLGTTLSNAVSGGELQETAALTQSTFAQLGRTAGELVPVAVNIAGAFAQASAALGVGAWDVFLSALRLAGGLLSAVAGPLETVTGFLNEHPALVTAALAAWTGFKTVPTVLGAINSVTRPHIDSLKQMGQGVRDIQAYYTATGREISKFGAAVQLAGTSNNTVVASMGRAYSQTATDAGRLGVAMGGLKAGFAGVKTAASGAVDALGGPWTLAIGAAVWAITDAQKAAESLDNAQAAMAVATRESAEAQRELSSALAGTTGQMGEQELAAAAKVAKAEFSELIEMGGRKWSIFDNINQSTVALDNFVAKIPGMYNAEGKAALEATNQAKALRETYESLESAAESAGVSMDELPQIVAEGGPTYDKIRESLLGMGESGERAAADLEAGRAKVQEITDAAAAVDPAAAAAARGIDVLADSSASAEDKLSALQSTMEAMGLVPQAAEQAMAGAAEAVEQIAEKAAQASMPVEELGQNLFDASGKLDTLNNGSARELSNALSSMVTELQSVATSGGDVDALYAKMQNETLPALAQAWGLPLPEVQKLAGEMGLLPDEIKTLVNVDADNASGELAKVWSSLYNLKEGETIEVQAVGDQAKAVLDDLKIEYEDLGNGNIELTATNDQARDALAEVSQMMGELGETEYSPTLFLDTTDMGIQADQAKAVLDALAIEEPSPRAQLIIDDLLAGKDVSVGEMNFLSAQSAVPTADLNKALLDAGVDTSKTALTSLHNQKTRPEISVNNQPAKSGIDSVISWLGGIKDKVVNIFTRHQEGRYGGGVVGQALYTGGTVGQPGGYRLPTYGPGTHEIDGFQGVDRYGRPTALVNAGEFVMNDRSTNEYLPVLWALNAGNTAAAVAALVGAPMQALAEGGVVTASELLRFFRGERVNGQQASRSLEGAPYVFGGSNWGDCSSTQGQGALFAVGQPATGGRFMATMNEREQLTKIGFVNGLGTGPRYAIGWFNAPGTSWGGHTSGTIYPESGAPVNVEMGGNRGNGQIGGGAAGATASQNTDVMHYPLGKTTGSVEDIDGTYDHDVASTSGSGYRTSGGRSVSWGEANRFYDDALEYLRAKNKAHIYDNGGWLMPNAWAYNAGRGGPEKILSGRESREYALMPEVAARFDAATDKLLAASDKAERQTVGFGRTFGGDFLGKAKIVRDAEQGLLETRMAIAEENDDITEKEKALAEAKAELRKAESEGAGLTTAQKRKLADAEEDVAKARREGKPDKIAAAEKKLARAREDVDEALEKSKDKNAKNVKSALDKVNKAEDALAKSRDEAEDQALRLEAAERAVAAARFQAAADLAKNVADQVAVGANAISDYFDEMARLAGIVEKMRESVSAMQMDKVNADLALMKAAQDLQVKEQDVYRARARGVMSVAEAEHNLDQARQAQHRLGMTSIEAMSGAMDRYRETGIFSIDSVTDETIENSAQVRAALWGVYTARQQALLDEHEAVTAQGIAAYELAEATLLQNSAVEMLRVSTDHLAAQAQQLGGMTANQASSASKGFGGVGKVASGGGKILGALGAAAAGFATMGPLGLLMGVPMLISGIGDVSKGAVDIHQNKKEMKEAWQGMDTGSKIAIVGGSVLGMGAGAAGGLLSEKLGPEAGALGAEIGAGIVDATVGTVQYSTAGKIEKLQKDYEDKRAALEANIEARKLELQAERLGYETVRNSEKDALTASVEFGKLHQLLAEANTKDEARAIAAAAEVEAERMGHMLDVATAQSQELTKINQTLSQMVAAADARSRALGTGLANIKVELPEGEAFTRPQVESFIDQTVSALEHRIAQLEAADQPGAVEYFAART